MVGLVLVSHSHRIAEGAAELAREMGGPEVALETAGGLDTPDHAIGTDAVLVVAAIERAWSEDGVLVLMDLGSAVLSAEMALDLLPEDRRAGVLLCEAPFIEGAVAAAVTARSGASLEDVAREARGGLAGKEAHLGTGSEDAGVGGAAADPAFGAGTSALTHTIVVGNPHGLHARPAARFVQTASDFDAKDRGPRPHERTRPGERGEPELDRDPRCNAGSPAGTFRLRAPGRRRDRCPGGPRRTQLR